MTINRRLVVQFGGGLFLLVTVLVLFQISERPDYRVTTDIFFCSSSTTRQEESIIVVDAAGDLSVCGVADERLQREGHVGVAWRDSEENLVDYSELEWLEGEDGFVRFRARPARVTQWAEGTYVVELVWGRQILRQFPFQVTAR